MSNDKQSSVEQTQGYICPVTKVQCDDECCVSAEDCHIKSWDQVNSINNKQSSVEWFAKESWKLRLELEDGEISLGQYANNYYQLKEQALQKQRWEHGQTWDAAMENMKERGGNDVRAWGDFDDYYAEKFNN